MDSARYVELDLDHLHAAIVPTREADVMRKRLGLAIRALDQRLEFERVVCTSLPPSTL